MHGGPRETASRRAPASQLDRQTGLFVQSAGLWESQARRAASRAARPRLTPRLRPPVIMFREKAAGGVETAEGGRVIRIVGSIRSSCASGSSAAAGPALARAEGGPPVTVWKPDAIGSRRSSQGRAGLRAAKGPKRQFPRPSQGLRRPAGSAWRQVWTSDECLGARLEGGPATRPLEAYGDVKRDWNMREHEVAVGKGGQVCTE